MTVLEAIEVIEERQTCRECVHTLNNKQEFKCGCDECDNAFGMAYDALKKQIPKKPDFEGDGYDENGFIIYDTWICPCCNEEYETEYEEYKHCPNCGQAIDWSDTE